MEIKHYKSVTELNNSSTAFAKIKTDPKGSPNQILKLSNLIS